MPALYGENRAKDELLKRVGCISQVAGVQRHELSGGRSGGVEAIEFRTGSGFMFSVLPGRGMDISRAEFRGAPLAWISPAGEAAPEYFEPEGLGWLRNFFGGLLTTCGLTYMGRPSLDGEQDLGLHGRISNIRAENVFAGGRWEGDDYIMQATGRLVEAMVFGEHVSLTRTITSKLGSCSLEIHDSVENEGHRTEPHMLLYHVNAGFPVVDEGSVLVSPSESVKPRGPEAAREAELYAEFSAPRKDYSERVYYHYMNCSESGAVSAAVVNRGFGGGEGLGLYLRYRINELPCFFEWKMNGEGVYAVGMEPANALGEGRAEERREGRLQFLEPGEKREYTLELGVLKSSADIDSFAAEVGRCTKKV